MAIENLSSVKVEGDITATGKLKGTQATAAGEAVVLDNSGKIPTSLISISYSDISDPPTIPTATSQLTNDSGFVTSDTKNTAGATDTSSKIFIIGATSQGANPQTYSQDSAYVGTDGCLYSGGNKVLTSAPVTSVNTKTGAVVLSASDVGALPDSTTIPTVYDATLTIQKNGTSVATFTANASSNVTANIEETSLSKGTTSGSGNAVTDISVNGHTITLTKGATFLTEHQSLSGYAPLASPALTGTPTAPTATSGTNTTQIATTAFVKSAIDGIPTPMQFKGTVGTGGTITSLPTATTDNKGYVYKAISAGTSPVTYKVGDTLVSDGSAWVVIPSGDEPSGTVTNVATGVGLTGGAITSTGTIKAKLRSETALTNDSAAATETSGRVYPVAVDKSGYLSVNVPWTDHTYNVYDKTLTLKSGTTNVAQFTSNSNTDVTVLIEGSGGTTVTPDATNKKFTISTPTLATVATSGSYSDLSNKPTIPTVYNATLSIKKNGTLVNSFTANASSDVTADISVPTKVSELTNDSGFITSYTDTKNTAGTTASTGTKLFLVGATTQAANPTTNSNANCYIGTDNCLYSGGSKVLTSAPVTSVNTKTGAVTLTASDIGAQATLVSGTNIKTINSQSILGSGNITVGLTITTYNAAE